MRYQPDAYSKCHGSGLDPLVRAQAGLSQPYSGALARSHLYWAEPGFEAIGPAWNGRFPARRGTGWGLIDATGAEVLPCVYDGLEWGFDELGVTRFHGIDPAFIPELEFYGRSRR